MLTSIVREPERLMEELHALTDVAKTLTASTDLPSLPPIGAFGGRPSTEAFGGLLDAVLRQILDFLEPAEAGVIMLWDATTGLLRPECACGYDFESLREMGLLPGESITGKVYERGAACVLATPTEVAASVADMRPANRVVMARALATEELPHSALAAHRNQVLLHEQLLTAVCGPEYRDGVEYLSAYIRYLHQKLELDPAHPQLIVASPGAGYMLVCPDSPPDNSLNP